MYAVPNVLSLYRVFTCRNGDGIKTIRIGIYSCGCKFFNAHISAYYFFPCFCIFHITADGELSGLCCAHERTTKANDEYRDFFHVLFITISFYNIISFRNSELSGFADVFTGKFCFIHKYQKQTSVEISIR